MRGNPYMVHMVGDVLTCSIDMTTVAKQEETTWPMTTSSHVGGPISSSGGNEGLSRTNGPRRGATVALSRVPSPRRVIEPGARGEGAVDVGGKDRRSEHKGRPDWVSLGSSPVLDSLSLRTLATSSIEFAANVPQHNTSLAHSTAGFASGAAKVGVVNSGSLTAVVHRSVPRVSTGQRSSRALPDYVCKSVRTSGEGASDVRKGSDVSVVQARNTTVVHSINLSAHGQSNLHAHGHQHGRGGGRSGGGRAGRGRSVLQERKDSVGTVAGSQGKPEDKGLRGEDAEGGGLNRLASARNSNGACRGRMVKDAATSSSSTSRKLAPKRLSKSTAGASTKGQDASLRDLGDSDSASTDSYVSITSVSVSVRRKMRAGKVADQRERNVKEGDGTKENEGRVGEGEMQANHRESAAGLRRGRDMFQSREEGSHESAVEEDLRCRRRQFPMPLHWETSLLVSAGAYEEEEDHVIFEAKYGSDSGERCGGRDDIANVVDACQTSDACHSQVVVEEPDGRDAEVEVAVEIRALEQEDVKTEVEQMRLPSSESTPLFKEDDRIETFPKRYEAGDLAVAVQRELGCGRFFQEGGEVEGCCRSTQPDICEDQRPDEVGRDAVARDIDVDVDMADVRIPSSTNETRGGEVGPDAVVRDIDVDEVTSDVRMPSSTSRTSGGEVGEVLEGPSLRHKAPQEVPEVGGVWMDRTEFSELPVGCQSNNVDGDLIPRLPLLARGGCKQHGEVPHLDDHMKKDAASENDVGREYEQEPAQLLRPDVEVSVDQSCLAIGDDGAEEIQTKRVSGEEGVDDVSDNCKQLQEQVVEQKRESMDEGKSAEIQEKGLDQNHLEIGDDSLEIQAKRVNGKELEAEVTEYRKQLAEQIVEMKAGETQGKVGSGDQVTMEECSIGSSAIQVNEDVSTGAPFQQGLDHPNSEVDGMNWGKPGEPNLQCNAAQVGGIPVLSCKAPPSAVCPPCGLLRLETNSGGNANEDVGPSEGFSQGMHEGELVATASECCNDNQDYSTDDYKDEDDDGADADCDSDEGGHNNNDENGPESGTKKAEPADPESDSDVEDCHVADGNNSHGDNPRMCGSFEECQKNTSDEIAANEQPAMIPDKETNCEAEATAESLTRVSEGVNQAGDRLSGSFVRLIRRSIDTQGSFQQSDEVDGGYHADHEHTLCDPSRECHTEREEEPTEQAKVTDDEGKNEVLDKCEVRHGCSAAAVRPHPHVNGRGECQEQGNPDGEPNVKPIKPASGTEVTTGMPERCYWFKYSGPDREVSTYSIHPSYEKGSYEGRGMEGENRVLFSGGGVREAAAARTGEDMIRARASDSHWFQCHGVEKKSHLVDAYHGHDIRARVSDQIAGVEKMSAYHLPYGSFDAKRNGRSKQRKGLTEVFMWEEKREKRETDVSEVEMMKERFAKLLLGEDMSGGSKGVCTALAMSNAITNLSASVFGQLWELAPLSPERKTKWRREMEWLLCVSDYIVELVPSQTRNPDGTVMEVMVCQQRGDIHANLPALRQLDSMLLDTLDSFVERDFWYMQPGPAPECERAMVPGYNKWWLPEVVIAQGGLPEESRKKLHQKRDCTSQILKAAMAINTQVLAEMEVPDAYWEQLPKSGKVALGDVLYRAITADTFTPEGFLGHADLSNEHSAVEMASQLEIAMHIWRRRRFWVVGGYKGRGTERPASGRRTKVDWSQGMNLRKDVRVLGSAQEKLGSMWALGGLGGDRRERLAERAEAALLVLRQKHPGLPQTLLDSYKIQHNKDVGQSLLESYSRVLESLASNIRSRIEDVLLANSLMTGVTHSPRSRYLSFSCNLLYPPITDRKAEHFDQPSGNLAPSPSTPSSNPSSMVLSGSLSAASSPALKNARLSSLSSFSSSLSSSSSPQVGVPQSHVAVTPAVRRSHRRWFSTNGKFGKSGGSLGGSSGGSSGGSTTMGSLSGTLDHVDGLQVRSEDYLHCERQHCGTVGVLMSDYKHNCALLDLVGGPRDESNERSAKPFFGSDKQMQPLASELTSGKGLAMQGGEDHHRDYDDEQPDNAYRDEDGRTNSSSSRSLVPCAGNRTPERESPSSMSHDDADPIRTPSNAVQGSTTPHRSTTCSPIDIPLAFPVDADRFDAFQLSSTANLAVGSSATNGDK
ncbi:hypothetical protein CBR_g57067 [Chara braunii]|uniref:PRONE domain-containing protein n=1 Tax=Chara braunii TaxID=69332 RepID=A0A388K817_CHABU|nr:hypothetical protein CBR_g57067 [Chara braunii]GBG66188.1 hypothetical protein CBR_g57067 [Chara braunii]|eukprot:GBG66187.1 hypothetical protein CBR_g57067 [Chara braunii]